MPDQTIGTDWPREELDAIVADYFNMLAADLSGRPYFKSKHRAALMAQIGRTEGSIEFKHQNISAVLDKLRAPWIPGYKPAKNYQHAILDAIDRYLTVDPASLEPPLHEPPPPPSVADIFVPSPALSSQAPIPSSCAAWS